MVGQDLVRMANVCERVVKEKSTQVEKLKTS